MDLIRHAALERARQLLDHGRAPLPHRAAGPAAGYPGPVLTRAEAHTTIDPDRPLSREGALTMTHGRIQGVLSPVVTPFKADLSPDLERFVRHCRWLLSQNVGLAAFGTNSEANSLSADERIDLLDGIIAAGLDPGRMMPGTGCCALTDTVRLTAHAMKAGCAGVLMLPPFYYKGVSDE